MADVPVQLIIAAFRDETTAGKVLDQLKKAKKDHLIGIKNAAVLVKDKQGTLHIKETSDMGGGKGAVLGGTVGGAIAILAGPVLAVPIAVGALVGGLAAKMRDGGFPDDQLRTVGEGLKPGSSAIIAVVEHRWVEQVRQDLEKENAQVTALALQQDIAQQLEADHDVAYSALASESGYAVGRVAGNDKEIDQSELVVGEDSVVGGRYVATKDGFTVVAIAADDTGATVIGIEGKPVESTEQKPAGEIAAGSAAPAETAKKGDSAAT